MKSSEQETDFLDLLTTGRKEARNRVFVPEV